MAYRYTILYIILFLTATLSLPSGVYAQSTSVTLVSDTTDSEDSLAESDTLNANVPLTVTPPDIDDISWWKFFLGEGNVWELAKSIVTGSSMLLFPLIILFGIILLPVILIVLLIIFLMRDRKRDKRQAYYTNPSEVNSHINTSEPRNLQKEKENLVIHCSVALGLLIFCIAYDWRFGTLLAIIYLCVQGGKLYNVWRAQKKDDNNNYF